MRCASTASPGVALAVAAALAAASFVALPLGGCAGDGGGDADAADAAVVAAVGGVRLRLIVPAEVPALADEVRAALDGEGGEVQIRRGVPTGGLDGVAFERLDGDVLRVQPYEGEQATRFVVELRVGGALRARADTALVIVRDDEPDRDVDALWVPPGRAVGLVDGAGAALVATVGAGASTTRLDDARVLVAGGAAGSAPCEWTMPETLEGKAQVVAPAALRVESTIALVDARAFHGAGLLAGGRVGLFGGYVAKAGALGASAGVEIVVPHEGRSEGASFALSHARARFGLAIDGERALLVGGDEVGVAAGTSTVELWSPTSGTIATAALNKRRVGPYAALMIEPGMERRLLFVAGGRGGVDAGVPLADGEVYEVRPDALFFAGTLPQLDPAAADASWLALPASTSLLRAGGATAGGALAQVSVFAATTGSWQPGPALSAARSCAATALIDGEVWIVGGSGGESAGKVVDRVVVGGEGASFTLAAGRVGGEVLAGPGLTLLLSGGVDADGAALGLSVYWPLAP